MSLEARTLNELLTSWGASVSPDVAEALCRHANAVVEANERLNLTRIVEQEAVTRLHVLDSLLALPYLVAAPAGEYADLGSGAGYPGIPLALAGGRRLSLVESVKKKAAFLEEITSTLPIEAVVYPLRAEEVAEILPSRFSVITARAVSSLPALVELAAPLLAPAGRLIAMKGMPESAEIAAGSKAAGICGLRLIERHTYRLPDAGESRSVFVFERIGYPGMKLPRRPGMAQRHPIA